MNETRKIGGPFYPSQEPRIETGAVQFGDDWPGLFIRGDDCLGIALSLSVLMERVVVDAERDRTLRMALSGVRRVYEVITKHVVQQDNGPFTQKPQD